MNYFSLLQSFLCWEETPLWLPFPPALRLFLQECFLEPQVYGDFLIDVDRLNLWSQLLQFKSELRVNVLYGVIVTAGSADKAVWEGLRK